MVKETEQERQLTTACTNQITGLNNSWAQIRQSKSSLVLSARFPVLKWCYRSVTKSTYNAEDKWYDKLQCSRRVMGRVTVCLVCDHHSWLSAELTCLSRTCCTLYRQAWWTFGVTALRLHGFHVLFHENNNLICPTKALRLAGCTLDDLLQANDRQCLHASILIIKIMIAVIIIIIIIIIITIIIINK